MKQVNEFVSVGETPKPPKGVYSGDAALFIHEETHRKAKASTDEIRAAVKAWLVKAKAPPAVVEYLSR